MFDWLVKLACVLRTPTVGQSIPTFCLKNTFFFKIFGWCRRQILVCEWNSIKDVVICCS